jgi:tRNA (cmo5U34)-methyltransferase
MNDIKTQFNNISQRYDGQRKLLIPCFDDFYAAAGPLLQRLKAPASLLDIGAGTGLFSYVVYQQLPQLQFTLLDISDAMLQVARQRFSGLPNFRFVEADFSTASFSGKYDIVISALAIHHLEDAAKIKLYRHVFEVLNPGGIFINADQVTGRSPFFDQYYKEQWRETVIQSGLDETAIQQAFERVKLDKFAPLEMQLQALEQAGFAEVDCVYKYQNFVVFAGLKKE